MNAELYRERRSRLLRQLVAVHGGNSLLVVSAHYEQARHRFLQESSFLYLTGLHEPGAVLVLAQRDDVEQTILFMPRFTGVRDLWVDCAADSEALLAGIEVRALGKAQSGYSASPHISAGVHADLLLYLQEQQRSGAQIGMLFSQKSDCIQRRTLEQWQVYLPELSAAVADYSALLARLRRKKDSHERAALEQAIAITHDALVQARRMVYSGSSESAVHAELVAQMLRAGAREAFPSIVASGSKSTVLHYERNNAVLCAGDLVVIDCGALWQGYAADISRTFPVSGRYNERQRALYEIVLEAQQVVFEAAQPGMWLRNSQEPERSLHHIALCHFARHNLERFFPHSIGHFLGLDVHDVGDVSEPLAPGDVITIEPGLYIPDERIGIRIEDDFMITETGATCLSDAIPRSLQEIERS